jgi:hypothetical protein
MPGGQRDRDRPYGEVEREDVMDAEWGKLDMMARSDRFETIDPSR